MLREHNSIYTQHKSFMGRSHGLWQQHHEVRISPSLRYALKTDNMGARGCRSTGAAGEDKGLFHKNLIYLNYIFKKTYFTRLK